MPAQASTVSGGSSATSIGGGCSVAGQPSKPSAGGPACCRVPECTRAVKSGFLQVRTRHAAGCRGSAGQKLKKVSSGMIFPGSWKLMPQLSIFATPPTFAVPPANWSLSPAAALPLLRVPFQGGGGGHQWSEKPILPAGKVFYHVLSCKFSVTTTPHRIAFALAPAHSPAHL